MISINKVHAGTSDPEEKLRFDWNSLLSDGDGPRFTSYSDKFFPDADDMVTYLNDFAGKYALNVRYQTRIASIDRNGDDLGSAGRRFALTDTNGATYLCDQLIVATGISKPFIPDIPGIEFAEDYATVSVDPQDFLDEKVLIIGKGNSAFETADNLMETTSVIHIAGPSSIKLAWRTHFVGHLRAVNNNFLDTYQLKSQNAIIDANVTNIVRRDDGKFVVTASFVRANEVHKDIVYDRVINCTGFKFDDSMFTERCRPTFHSCGKVPAQTSEWESTNVKNLYFAGVLTQARDYKKTTSAFIHGFRYNARALARILASKVHSERWPKEDLNAEPAALMATVIERVNRTSALWQQFGFLCDVLVVDRERHSAEFFEEMPADYVADTMATTDCYFTITLEYGPDHDKVDPFDVSTSRVLQSDAYNALDSQYLHPVIRRWHRGSLLAEHHIVENLENEWTDVANHKAPLEAFFVNALSGGVAPEQTAVLG